MGASFYA
jgi:hypothetical protein